MKLPLLFLCIAVIQSNAQSNLQQQIDGADSGATVIIPAGTFSWTGSVEIKKSIKLVGTGDGQTIIRNDSGTSNWNAALIWVVPQATGPIEIANIRFVKGNTVGKQIVVQPGNGVVMVHDCYFGWRGGGRSIEWQNNGGLIYNCEFVSEDRADNSGIAFKNPGSDSAWKEASTLGDRDRDGNKNTYVEDCVFRDIYLQAFDFDDNSRAVIRYCTFDNSGGSSHGQDTSPIGMRQFEVYNNTFTFTLGGNCNPNPYPLNLNYWLFIRGGTGVIFNNVIPDIQSCAWGTKGSITFTVYNIRRRSQFISCQRNYPAARQIGFGSDAQGRQIADPVYIWGNTGGSRANTVGMVDYDDECGNGLRSADFIRLNRDYFLGQAKNGYKSYAYPHPWRTSVTPTPTPTATPTVAPTPTPAPTATPGTSTYRQWLDKLGDWIKQNPPTSD